MDVRRDGTKIEGKKKVKKNKKYKFPVLKSDHGNVMYGNREYNQEYCDNLVCYQMFTINL